MVQDRDLSLPGTGFTPDVFTGGLLPVLFWGEKLSDEPIHDSNIDGESTTMDIAIWKKTGTSFTVEVPVLLFE